MVGRVTISLKEKLAKHRTWRNWLVLLALVLFPTVGLVK